MDLSKYDEYQAAMVKLARKPLPSKNDSILRLLSTATIIQLGIEKGDMKQAIETALQAVEVFALSAHVLEVPFSLVIAGILTMAEGDAKAATIALVGSSVACALLSREEQMDMGTFTCLCGAVIDKQLHTLGTSLQEVCDKLYVADQVGKTG